jgi:SAM-dependent methyltransferase
MGIPLTCRKKRKMILANHNTKKSTFGDLQEEDATILGGTYSDVLDDRALEAIANSKAYVQYANKGVVQGREGQYINTLKYFFGERFNFDSVVKVFEDFKKGVPASELRELLPLGGNQKHFPFGDKEARADRIANQFFNELTSPEVGLEPSAEIKMLDIGSMDGLIPQSLGRSLKTTADNIFCIDVHVVGDANVTWLEYGDDWYIPLPDQSLDLVVCSQVLHHIGDFTAIAATIKKIYRLLKKDGLFLIKEHDSLLNDKSFAAFLDTIHLAYERLNMEPEYSGIHLMNKVQLDSRIRQVGFERAKDTKPRGDERIYISVYRRV